MTHWEDHSSTASIRLLMQPFSCLQVYGPGPVAQSIIIIKRGNVSSISLTRTLFNIAQSIDDIDITYLLQIRLVGIILRAKFILNTLFHFSINCSKKTRKLFLSSCKICCSPLENRVFTGTVEPRLSGLAFLEDPVI